MVFARSALLSTVLLYVIASQRTLLRLSHRGNSLDVRLLPDMVAQALTASDGRKRFLSQDDLECERCFTQDGMVYDLKAIGVQIVESTCSVGHNSILNYLKKAADVLGIEFDCEPDVKIILDPMPSMVQASATCTGGNPVLGTNDPGSSCQRYLEVIHLGAAWRAARCAKLKLKDVVLAVIDTGVDTTHPDLVNQFWRNPADGSIGFNFAKNNTNVTDVLRHGTHCAGSAVAQTNNCIGIAGVANIEGPPPKVKLMVLKIFDDSGVGLLSYSLRALNFAVENGATVSSHSYRWYNTSELQKAAYKNAAAAGHIAVAAAGNEALDLEKNRTYPCCLAEDIPSMLCVAA
ncbi:subtilisin, putative, partial [Perkinsus marinus ATCC 50983]